MRYGVLILVLVMALFKVETSWANHTNVVDAVLLKNKSEGLIYDLMGHLEYNANKGFVQDDLMLDSLNQLIQDNGLNGAQGYAYVINTASGKVTWSTLSPISDQQNLLITNPIGDDFYIQSNTKNYFLAKNFWVKTSSASKENFQLVLAINY